MKILTASVCSALALSLVACEEAASFEDVTAVTQDIVDATADISILSLEIESEFEAAGVVARELVDVNGYASILASTLAQAPDGCITAVATEAIVDVTWACPDISGASQISVVLTDATLTFTNTATDLQIGDAVVSYQNIFVVDELAIEGELTRDTSITRGANTFRALGSGVVALLSEGRQIALDAEVDLNDGEDTLTFSALTLARGGLAPLGGEASSARADSFNGGYVAKFSEGNGAFFINATNAFFGLTIKSFNFFYQIDTANNNVLLPILEE